MEWLGWLKRKKKDQPLLQGETHGTPKSRPMKSVSWQPTMSCWRPCSSWGRISVTARNNWAWLVLQLWNYPRCVSSELHYNEKAKMSTPHFPRKYLKKKTVTKGGVLRERERNTEGKISWNIHVTFSLMLHLNYCCASHANPIGRLCQEIHNHSAILITPVGFLQYLICTRHCGHYQRCVSASALRVSGNQI